MLCFLSSPVWWRPLLRTARRCEDPVATWSSLAFLLALTWLFGASASYHLGPWTLEQEMVAAKLDFLGIALVISYNVCPMFSLRMKDAASRNAHARRPLLGRVRQVGLCRRLLPQMLEIGRQQWKTALE